MAKSAIGTFDRTACPLLVGLSAEDQDRLIAADPRIRACIAAVDCGTGTSPEADKYRRAYDACCRKAGKPKVSAPAEG